MLVGFQGLGGAHKFYLVVCILEALLVLCMRSCRIVDDLNLLMPLALQTRDSLQPPAKNAFFEFLVNSYLDKEFWD